MPMRRTLEGGAERQQAGLGPTSSDELDGQRQAVAVESSRKTDRTATDVVDPARELAKRCAAFVDRIQ